jgi:hypothetical protein
VVVVLLLLLLLVVVVVGSPVEKFSGSGGCPDF